MADILNLRRFRKARQQADKNETAAQNRVLFGRPKAEREAALAALQKEARRLEDHRREPRLDTEPTLGTEPDA